MYKLTENEKIVLNKSSFSRTCFIRCQVCKNRVISQTIEHYTCNGNLYICGRCMDELDEEIILFLPLSEECAKKPANECTEFVKCNDCYANVAPFHLDAYCDKCRCFTCVKCYNNHPCGYEKYSLKKDEITDIYFTKFNVFRREPDYLIKKDEITQLYSHISDAIEKGDIPINMLLYHHTYKSVLERVINYYTKELEYIDKKRSEYLHKRRAQYAENFYVPDSD